MQPAETVAGARSGKKEFSPCLNKTNVDVHRNVVKVLAAASSIGNTIGFLANFILYGVNIPTAFCGVCALLCWLHLIFGVRSKYYMTFGAVLLALLCILEFPLLTFTYGPVMYPYMVLGFSGVVMLTEGKVRNILVPLLIAYDVAVIVLSTLHPYIFGAQDPTGLMGSAVCTYLVTVIALAVCLLRWQEVYVRQSSDVDPVTQTLTRAGFVREAGKLMKGAVPGQYLLLYFDIVNFKSVNAVYGIETGNRVLAELADRIACSPQIKPLLVSRPSSDRFYVLAEDSSLKYDKLEDICRFRYTTNTISLNLQLNCGIYKIVDPSAGVPAACDRARSVVEHSALVRKQHYAMYDAVMEEQFIRETEIFAMVEEALAKEAFEPFFQPIVDCKTGKIVSAEALARWVRPDNTVVSPGLFIPVLEKKELISTLDYQIAKKVNMLLEKRNGEHKRIVPVSVNLSRVDLYNEKLMENLQIMVRESAIKDDSYHFEVTESVYEAIPKNIAGELAKFRSLGAKILIDDFGSGYSSLGMITDFEFDIVKLDMSFAKKIDQGEKTRGVIRSLIELSHNLGAKVVCEGVESRSQYEFLKDNGCDLIQGYYFYRPMNTSDFIKLLDDCAD